MAITVKIPAQLRATTDGEDELEVSGDTVGEALDAVFESCLARERSCPGAVVHNQRLSHVTQVRARKRDETLGSGFSEPALAELRTASVAIAAVGACQQLTKLEVADM